MPSFTALREALAANLATIPDVQVSAYVLGNPNPPTIEIMPAEADYDKSFQRGLDLWNLRVRAMVGFTQDIGAQKRLDKMLAPSGASSVKAAIEADSTLNGKADDLRVIRCSGYRLYGREQGHSLLGAEWMVEVYAAGM